jgi:exodeoxyribonuclease V beta subunit
LAVLKKGQGKTSILHQSAMGYLLNNAQPLTSSSALSSWFAEYNTAIQESKTVGIATPISHICTAPSANADCASSLDAPFSARWRIAQRRTREHWWIASYSALRLSAKQPESEHAVTERVEDLAPQSPFAQNISDDEHYEASNMAPLSQATENEQACLHSFPRGAKPGTFLHGLLEWAAEQGFAAVLEQPEKALQMIQVRCASYGFEAYSSLLWPWLSDYLQRAFHVGGKQPLRFSKLNHYQAEMEFWFATHNVDTQQLDRQIRQFILPGSDRPYLERERLNGMFKGFIDLVVEHAGCYYVIDYKSNWLGSESADYSEEAINACVLSHRYDLQYVLYVLALHRLLRLRIPDYDYDMHIGGVVYMFLRGAHNDSQGLHNIRPPRELIETLDALFQSKSVEGQ